VGVRLREKTHRDDFSHVAGVGVEVPGIVVALLKRSRDEKSV